MKSKYTKQNVYFYLDKIKYSLTYAREPNLFCQNFMRNFCKFLFHRKIVTRETVTFKFTYLTTCLLFSLMKYLLFNSYSFELSYFPHRAAGGNHARIWFVIKENLTSEVVISIFWTRDRTIGMSFKNGLLANTRHGISDGKSI